MVALLEGVSSEAAAVPAERVAPVDCLAAVLPEVVVPVLRRAVVPVEPVLPVLPLLRFTWPLPEVPALRFTWVEALPEGAAVLLEAVVLLLEAEALLLGVAALLEAVPVLRVAVEVLWRVVEVPALRVAVADLLSEELEVEVVVVLRLAWARSSGAAAAREKTRTLASAILNVVLIALKILMVSDSLVQVVLFR